MDANKINPNIDTVQIEEMVANYSDRYKEYDKRISLEDKRLFRISRNQEYVIEKLQNQEEKRRASDRENYITL